MTSFNPNSEEYLLIQLQNYGLSTLLLSAVDFPNYDKLRSLSKDFNKYLDLVLQKPETMAYKIYIYKKMNWRWNKTPIIKEISNNMKDILEEMIKTNDFSNLSILLNMTQNDLMKGDVLTFEKEKVKIGLVKGEDEMNILVFNVDGEDLAPPLPIYYGLIKNTPVNYWNSYHNKIHFKLNIPIVFDKIVWDTEDYQDKYYLVGKVNYSLKNIKIILPLSLDDWNLLKNLLKDEQEILIDEEEIDELDLDEIGKEELVKEKRFIKSNKEKITTRFALSKNIDDLEIYSNKDELYNFYPQDMLTIFVPNDYSINQTLDIIEEIQEFDLD
jgi:hypothetical protein